MDFSIFCLPLQGYVRTHRDCYFAVSKHQQTITNKYHLIKITMKKILSIISLAVLTIGLLGSCEKDDPKVSVTGVTLDKTTLTITVGDADVKLTATVAPDNATDKTVSWSSDNAEFATVDNQGNVHAVAPGTANITVTTTDGGKTATCAVTVEAAKVPVTGVTLDKTTLKIGVGDPDVKLTATVAPDDATDKSISWSSDNTDVATVDDQGNVHAVAAGSANITVTTTDGGKTATCAVTVTIELKEILATNPDFPESNNLTAPVNAWVNSTNSSYKAFIGVSSGKKYFLFGSSSFLALTLSTAFEKTGDNSYSITDDNYGVFIFSLTEGKVSSFTYQPSSGSSIKQAGGTYAPRVLPAGALKGVFTVNNQGKRIFFSQGNLVATINASGTPTAWKFATNQYDYIGEGGANKTIGKSAGDVDLFGWSTDAASNNWGIHTMVMTTTGYTDGNFKDWGTAINDNGTWRTLSKEEWAYLINRKGKHKYGVTVCEKTNCLILAPDNFQGTIAASYDAAAWATAEAAGLVCLPAAGDRKGSDVYDVGNSGGCWSSSTGASGINSYSVAFDSSSISNETYNDRRFIGLSVRLVTDID